ncbi:MAG: septum formation initiator family protein [Candidatus Ornithomonoglobus sp.]
MKEVKNKLLDFVEVHKRGILLWAVILASGSMIFKGVMQRPQINQYRAEIADLNEKIQQERDRQAEIDDLKTKVNTDEYIEKIASEKLGLVKSNAKIFIDVSDDN